MYLHSNEMHVVQMTNTRCSYCHCTFPVAFETGRFGWCHQHSDKGRHTRAFFPLDLFPLCSNLSSLLFDSAVTLEAWSLAFEITVNVWELCPFKALLTFLHLNGFSPSHLFLADICSLIRRIFSTSMSTWSCLLASPCIFYSIRVVHSPSHVGAVSLRAIPNLAHTLSVNAMYRPRTRWKSTNIPKCWHCCWEK